MRLDQLVPVLHHEDQLTLQIRGFSARPANGLQRAGICTWQQLIAMTPADLLGLPAVGRKSVIEIIASVLSRAAVQSLLGLDRHASGDAVSPGSRMDPGEAKMPHEPDLALLAEGKPDACSTAALPGLQILARWAVCIGARPPSALHSSLQNLKFSRTMWRKRFMHCGRPHSSHRSVLRPG